MSLLEYVDKLVKELNEAQEEYNRIWATDIVPGVWGNKIDRDLKLEEAGDRLERARIAYQEAIG